MKLVTWASFLRLLNISEKNLGASWISAIFSLCKKLFELQWTWEYQWISNLPPPHKKREVTSHRDSPTFGEIVPSLVHTPVFHGWLPPCPQVLLSSQGPKNCTVLPAACWSRSSWDRITIKILRWFCWLSKILTIPFFFPILRFLRIFVNFRGFWPLFEMMTIQGLRAEAEWPADWTRSTCFLLLWSQRGRKYIAFLLFSYILCDTDKDI